jgi:hypothetical protein
MRTIAAMIAAAWGGISDFGGLAIKLTLASSDPLTDLPDELLREIGKTMVLLAHLEWRLSRFAYALMGVDRNVGRISVREPRAAERFDMVCELLNYKGAESKADLSNLRQRIQTCDDQRNLLAHGTWTRDPVHNALRIIRTTGQWQPTPQHRGKTKRAIHPEGVLFEMREASALNEELGRLTKEVLAWIAESQPPPA